MADPLGISVGRVRVTVAASPSEAGYIRGIRTQMNVIMKNMQKLIDGVENATPQAIKFGLIPMFEESQRLVPIDTGNLKASGYVEVRTEPRGGRIRAEIGYGRHGRPHYAGFVHEMLQIPHAPPTQAKYLEAAINKHIGEFPFRIARFMQKATGIGT